jgi:hypothetical protein
MFKALQRIRARRGHARRTTDDCTRMGALLPLHVAGDLSAAQTQLVARHLHACADCRAQFDEYEASRAWLQTGAHVQFEEEFYEDIRANVLRRIGQQRPPAPVFAPLRNRRFAYAVAFALLCICGALAWRAHEQQQRRSEPQFVQIEVRPQPAPSNAPSPSQPAPSAAPRREQEPSRVYAAFSPTRKRTTVRRLAPATPSAARDENIAALNAAAQATPEADVHAIVASQVARIELQTADPNIRIIWLAPEPAAANPQPKPERR